MNASRKPSRIARGWAAAGLALGLALPVTAAAQGQAALDDDPWEPYNRRMFWFNDKVDVWVLEPVATGYDWVMPDFLQDSISNFFQNVAAPVEAVNALLQGKPDRAGVATGRFLFNSVVGIAGFFDPALTELDLEPVNEDFGQTLAVWGVGSGPYFVLPFLGASTPRDAVGLGVDNAMAVYQWFIPTVPWLATRGTQVVNGRAQVLEAVRDSKAAAFDYYVFVRNAYLQYRQKLIADQEADTRDADIYQLDVDE